jgi:fructose-specific component phosphotransferase system IIB-like protein
MSFIELDPLLLPPKKAPAKRKMRPGGGKAKGNGFEGTIAKKLTAALAPLNFMRTPGSGARVGGKNFATLGQMMGEDALKIFVGDVVPVNEKQTGLTFLHSIECKAYATPDNFTSLAMGTANVYKWYEEAVVDAAKIGKNPLLIFKWNMTPIFVASDVFKDESLGKSTPLFSILTYGENGGKARALDVWLLDDLLQKPSFWFKPAT